MSYDIWFCQRPDQLVDPVKLRQTLASLPNITESQFDDGQLIEFSYENLDMGVYCVFDLQGPDFVEDIDVSTQYIPPGLSVSINLVRPSFFATELMPMIAGVADAAGLLIIDPQQDNPVPEAPNAATLIDRWTTHNERVTLGMAHQPDQPIVKPYLVREEAVRW